MTSTNPCPVGSALPPILEGLHAYHPHRPLPVNRHVANLEPNEESLHPNLVSLEHLPNRLVSLQDNIV
jgi:hypothetical protein